MNQFKTPSSWPFLDTGWGQPVSVAVASTISLPGLFSENEHLKKSHWHLWRALFKISSKCWWKSSSRLLLKCSLEAKIHAEEINPHPVTFFYCGNVPKGWKSFLQAPAFTALTSCTVFSSGWLLQVFHFGSLHCCLMEEGRGTTSVMTWEVKAHGRFEHGHACVIIMLAYCHGIYCVASKVIMWILKTSEHLIFNKCSSLW